jgi:hypothetical protein
VAGDNTSLLHAARVLHTPRRGNAQSTLESLMNGRGMQQDTVRKQLTATTPASSSSCLVLKPATAAGTAPGSYCHFAPLAVLRVPGPPKCAVCNLFRRFFLISHRKSALLSSRNVLLSPAASQFASRGNCLTNTRRLLTKEQNERHVSATNAMLCPSVSGRQTGQAVS